MCCQRRYGDVDDGEDEDEDDEVDIDDEATITLGKDNGEDLQWNHFNPCIKNENLIRPFFLNTLNPSLYTKYKLIHSIFVMRNEFKIKIENWKGMKKSHVLHPAVSTIVWLLNEFPMNVILFYFKFYFLFFFHFSHFIFFIFNSQFHIVM